MKKLLSFLYAITIALSSFATGQQADLLFIDGEKWILLGRPVYADSVLYNSLIDILPKGRSITTANWDGFQGYWSIRNDWLILDSICVSFWDKDTHQYWQESIPSADMHRVFGEFYDKDSIVATWLTDTIRIGKGEQIYYMHDGFERNHEYEQLVAIKEGHMTGRQSYHNRVVVDGFSLSGLKRDVIKSKFPLDFNSCSEIDGMKTVIFNIGDILLDSLGNMIDCRVRAIIPGSDPDQKNPQCLEKLGNDMKQLLKSISPWKTLFINGEYVPETKHGFFLPYRIGDN